MNYYKITKDNLKNDMINLNLLKSKIEDYNRRDLYFIESDIRFDISSLIIKKNCIICKLDNIKVIIFLDEAHVIYNKLLSENEIKIFLNNQNPFHLNILEFLLIKVTDTLENEFTNMFNNYLLIRNDEYEINKNFIVLQSNLINLEYRVKELHSVTEELLNNKEDLKKLTFNKCEESNTEELIENYDLKLEDIYNDITKLVKEMDNVQKVANIKLAKDRNKFAILNLYISYISLSVSIGSFIGSMFGMNLKNYLETSKFGFVLVLNISLFLIFALSIIQIYYFKKTNNI
jgi:magnesium transporter